MDFSDIYPVFFEESLELIDSIEKVMLNLDVAQVSAEDLNAIFRCAHSIKGSSSAFGFLKLTNFTHILESYLDLVRKGKKSLTRESLDVLLLCLDCLRSMIHDLQNNREIDDTIANALSVKINTFMGDEPAKVSSEIKTKPEAIPSDPALLFKPPQGKKENKKFAWKIYFKPDKRIFQNGNDPLRLIEEISKLGELSSEVDLSGLPELNQFVADESYLAWRLTLLSDKSEKEIRENTFDWMRDESVVDFSLMNEIIEKADPNNTSQPSAQVSKSETPAQVSQPVAPAPKPEIKPAVENKPVNKEAASIRVSTDKVDSLVNIVGELVITQAIVTELVNNFDKQKLPSLKEGLDKLEHNIRLLQDSVMRIRMLPISNVFSRFPRMVRDLSTALNKKIELKMSGENTELDKTVLEKIGDPLVHLVRNSVDHGIEGPAERKANGKPETGTLHLSAYHQGGNIVIAIIDDGKGLNREKILKKAKDSGLVGPHEELTGQQIDDLIWRPGFSTADKVTDISGRGVGTDVVKKNIEALGGTVELKSNPGIGTTFTITLPLTLAILEGQLTRVGDHNYIVPLVSMSETIRIQKENINKLSSEHAVYRLRNEYIPIIPLYELFNIKLSKKDLENFFLIVVEVEGKRYGIVINELLQQQQIVIKSIESNYKRIEGIAGATILSDGRVSLILDITGVIRLSAKKADHS